MNQHYELDCPSSRISVAIELIKQYTKTGVNSAKDITRHSGEKWFVGYEKNLGHFAQFLGLQ